MLRRKIEDFLVKWKQNPNRKPLVIMGIRQCGKTYITKLFAEKNYTNTVYINFVKNPELSASFAGSKDVDTILLNLSAQIIGAKFIEKETCIILDEIQDCPDARTSLKFFQEDGRFDIIATGSLLGIHGYGDKNKSKTKMGKVSIPVGYEQIVEMFPLDFEEFLWANGITDKVISAVRHCYSSEVPVPEGIHEAMKTLLNRFIAVGGLPAAVNAFIGTYNMNDVEAVYRSIIKEYQEDMVKYADDKDKPYIRECFNSVPKQLANENKKFQYAKVKSGGRGEMYKGSLQWLEDAGIIRRCYNTQTIGLPLEGNAIESIFKVYISDIGLLIAMLGREARADVLQGNLGSFKGAIYENLMADTLIKKGVKLYYYHKESGLELDFLVRLNGKCVPLEVKATNAQAKSLKTVLKHTEKYHIDNAIKFGDFNVGRNGALLTLPTYMQFLLDFEPVYPPIEPIDVDALRNLTQEYQRARLTKPNYGTEGRI